MADSAAHATTLIGRTIGNYEVIEKLGEGGMGAVYLARHPRIGKKVALKVLHAEFASDTNIVDRFFTEAKSVNDIGHPNIVNIFDYGEFPGDDGKPVVYFFMEYLDGESIADVIARDAPVAPDRVFRVAAQIADALGASHEQMVVHRDLKPDNIFLTKRGRMTDLVKVLDFGIAKLTGDQPGSRRTRTGIVIGTPYYMSPEQCEGKGNVDRRTDIYALGIVMYEMLTKHVPFDGEGYGEILVQHLTQLPPRMTQYVPNLSPYVEAIVLKALEKHRDNRYQTMEEFLQALADPVAFVDARGGLQGFLSGGSQIRLDHGPGYVPPPGGNAPVPGYTPPLNTPVPIQTPAPADQSSPFAAPGAYGRPGTAPPSQYAPTPPPVGSYDVDDERPPRSRAPLFVGLALVAAAGAAGLLLAMNRGGSDGDAAEADLAAAAEQPIEAEVPPAEPPEPAMIEIELSSEPTEASVFVGDETEPRGVTPLELELEQGDEPVTLILKKDGFEDESKVLTPDRNAVVDVSLKAIPKVAKDDSKKKKRRRSSSRRSKRKKKEKRSKVGDDILVPDL